MSKVRTITRSIRDILHDSNVTRNEVFFKKNQGFWDQLWTSLDNIDDTEDAIQSFLKTTSANFESTPYIHTYGLLQALYIQQDAVENLKESIFGITINWKKEYPTIYLIRNIRNETTGHPSKNYLGRYCVIDRHSLSKGGFSYAVWSKTGFTKDNIIFADLLQKQEKALDSELTALLKLIQSAELEHKKKFKGQSLSKLLPDKEPYSLSLLRKLAFDELGWIGFLHYKDKYKQIKLEIEARYGQLDKTLNIPGTKLLLEELDRIFLRIMEMKKSIEDFQIDLGIYADALVDKLKELQVHLREIDAEFKSE